MDASHDVDAADPGKDRLACTLAFQRSQSHRFMQSWKRARVRLGYTMIGDEVNIAARLETLNRTYRTSRTLIIVSESTREHAGLGAICVWVVGTSPWSAGGLPVPS